MVEWEKKTPKVKNKQRRLDEYIGKMRTLNMEKRHDIEKLHHEADMLKLDSSKAMSKLKWEPVWACTKSIEKTISWYRDYYRSGNIPSLDQLESYFSDAKTKHAAWID